MQQEKTNGKKECKEQEIFLKHKINKNIKRSISYGSERIAN